jgi:predicted RNase H-like nuclease (RuvC/YqgF family)
MGSLRIMDSIQELQAALEAKDAEIARLKLKVLGSTFDENIFEARAIAAESRISDLERQLAEETERCARVAERAGCGDAKCTGCYGNQIAAAIRGGAK